MNIIENNNLIAEYASKIRSTTLKRLEEVPDGFINWRLNNTAMSFVDIVQHLINVDELFFHIIMDYKEKYKWVLGTEEPHINVDSPTYESMINKLKDFQTKRHTVIGTLDKAFLNEEIIDKNGHEMTIWSFLMHKVIEHEIYHRGQISAYLKVLKGESS